MKEVLAPSRKRVSGCAPLRCCCHAPASPDSPTWRGDCSPPPTMPRIASVTDQSANGHPPVKLGIPLKSSLRHQRASKSLQLPDPNPTTLGDASDFAIGIGGLSEQRKSVQWLDSHGKELIEVREFQPSDVDDDGELFHGCTCAIQ